MIKTFAKDDFESLDYVADYTEELNVDGDKIVESIWIVPSDTAENVGTTSVELKDGITVDYSVSAPSPQYRLNTSGAVSLKTYFSTKIFLRGGTLGATYQVMNRIVTTAGRKYSRVFNVYIQRKGS